MTAGRDPGPGARGREGDAPPLARMAIALLALVGVFVSGYLAMYNYGFLGVIQCSVGGCTTVQASPYAYFPPGHLTDAGVPVSVMGIAAYSALLVLALVGIQPRWVRSRGVALAIFAVAGAGVLFSAYLTYLEAAVIRAWCQWCVVSAVLVTLMFLLSLPGPKRAR